MADWKFTEEAADAGEVIPLDVPIELFR